MSTLVPYHSDPSCCKSCGNSRRPNILDDYFYPFTNPTMHHSTDHLLRDVVNIAGALQRQDNSVTSVTVDKTKFQANFDVQQFKPEEITVKITRDNAVSIEAKHAEKQEPQGQVSRHFARKYVLPRCCDLDKLESKLSSDGVLTIIAPTIAQKVDERIIPISKTGQPAKCWDKKQITEK